MEDLFTIYNIAFSGEISSSLIPNDEFQRWRKKNRGIANSICGGDIPRRKGTAERTNYL